MDPVFWSSDDNPVCEEDEAAASAELVCEGGKDVTRDTDIDTLGALEASVVVEAAVDLARSSQ